MHSMIITYFKCKMSLRKKKFLNLVIKVKAQVFIGFYIFELLVILATIKAIPGTNFNFPCVVFVMIRFYCYGLYQASIKSHYGPWLFTVQSTGVCDDATFCTLTSCTINDNLRSLFVYAMNKTIKFLIKETNMCIVSML